MKNVLKNFLIFIGAVTMLGIAVSIFIPNYVKWKDSRFPNNKEPSVSEYRAYDTALEDTTQEQLNEGLSQMLAKKGRDEYFTAFVDSMIPKLPMKVDKATTLRSVQYSKESQSLLYTISLTGQDLKSENEIIEYQKAFSCSNKIYRSFMENNIMFSFIYTKDTGEYLFSNNVTIEDCQKIH